MQNTNGYLQCSVTVLSETGDKPYIIMVESLEDKDGNVIEIGQEAEIEDLNIHPESRAEIRDADTDDDIKIYVDEQWLTSENML